MIRCSDPLLSLLTGALEGIQSHCTQKIPPTEVGKRHMPSGSFKAYCGYAWRRWWHIPR